MNTSLKIALNDIRKAAAENAKIAASYGTAGSPAPALQSARIAEYGRTLERAWNALNAIDSQTRECKRDYHIDWQSADMRVSGMMEHMRHPNLYRYDGRTIQCWNGQKWIVATFGGSMVINEGQPDWEAFKQSRKTP